MITAVGPRVPGEGPIPCPVMLVGEGPGEEEAYSGHPFKGRSGQLQDKYLMMHGLHRRRIYITNLIKNWIPGNGNPTEDDIRAAEPELTDELHRVSPRFVLAVGAFACRWFLGPDADLESTHGRPYTSPRLPPSTVVIPCYHPAYGLRDSDGLTLVWWDYQQVGKIIRGEIPATQVVDEYPNPIYIDAGPEDFELHASLFNPQVAADVEGPLEFHLRDRYWGFSLCFEPGTGLVFRRSHPGFTRAVKLLNDWTRRFNIKPELVLHNGIGLDMEALRLMGVDLSLFSLYDTMIAAYFLRVEPQGLKPLAKRHCGMEMRTYEEVIGQAAFEKQMAYLVEIATSTWPNPDPEVVYENDGTCRLYRGQGVGARVGKILEDYGNKPLEVDLAARYAKIGKPLRQMVARRFGDWPVATLDDIGLESAINYAGRDPDATLRLRSHLAGLIHAASLEDRLQLDLDILPCFEEMQATGFIANRASFEQLSADMWDRMMRIGSYISTHYNYGEPFNPMSQPQVSALAKARGLRGAKKTKTGAVSTSKKSMEHLRTVDDAMDKIFEWREHEKVKDSYADPILERIPDGVDRFPIRCNIKLTRVAQDRIAASDPNLTGMPVASDLGLMVRNGFEAPEGCSIGTADLSQIEMRFMAHLSGDPFLCKLFLEGRDIHAETAALIFHILLSGVRKMEHRNPTKRAGFGVITGIQGPGLLDQLRQMGCEGWRVEKFPDGQSDCVSDWCPKGIIHEWFRIYPGVKGFLAKCRNRTSDKGVIREMGGFMRYLPGIWSDEPYIAAEAGRQSHSHVISGSAQWALRCAMRWLKPYVEELRESTGMYLRWTMQIHDEILFTFDDRLHDTLKTLVLEALTEHSCNLKVPVEANWASAKKWGQLEK